MAFRCLEKIDSFSALCQILRRAHHKKQYEICFSSRPAKLHSSHHNTSKFFVTTPIFYVNASPHLGHLYTSVLADAVSRFSQLQDNYENLLFTTGTDENGLKVQCAAKNASVPVKEYCDKISPQFRLMCDDFDVMYTDFIRTTESRHMQAVQQFYSILIEKDFTYKAEYSGWYSTSDETFLTESQVTEKLCPSGESVKVSLETGNKVEWSSETNYMFKLSNLRDDVLYWLKDDCRVKPTLFLKNLRRMAHELTYDLSISRPVERVSWGIPVPGDDKHTIYVWVDALVNYLTVAGFPSNCFKKYWSPDVQVLGKDILKFHGLYWPALLIAAGLEPPKQLLVHSHWVVNGQKMSKSLGNVVHPSKAAEIMTAEGVRYLLLRCGVLNSDASWREKEGIALLNSELGDTLGNLLLRCTGLKLNTVQIFPPLQDAFLENSSLVKDVTHIMSSASKKVSSSYREYNFSQGICIIMDMIRNMNRFIDVEKPWKLQKTDPERMANVLHLGLSACHAAAIMLQPVVPQYATRILNRLGIAGDQRLWKHIERFPTANGSSSSLGETVIPFVKI